MANVEFINTKPIETGDCSTREYLQTWLDRCESRSVEILLPNGVVRIDLDEDERAEMAHLSVLMEDLELSIYYVDQDGDPGHWMMAMMRWKFDVDLLD